MTAETYSASLVSRFAVPSTTHRIPQGYYRSKLFIASSTTNPLVAAAGPLLSLLERLCISPTLPPINSIRENIQHELHAFHSRLTGLHYAEELIAIAHYLLSATIDELLGKNYVPYTVNQLNLMHLPNPHMMNRDRSDVFLILLTILKSVPTNIWIYLSFLIIA